jgi:hypothetical protein
VRDHLLCCVRCNDLVATYATVAATLGSQQGLATSQHEQRSPGEWRQLRTRAVVTLCCWMHLLTAARVPVGLEGKHFDCLGTVVARNPIVTSHLMEAVLTTLMFCQKVTWLHAKRSNCYDSMSWGSDGSEYEDGCLLGCSAVWTCVTARRPDDGGSTDRWIVGKLTPFYTALQHRRQPSS